ncbi:MAG: hypothetical protein K9W43_03235 [Candidatus Thorarchaeota archaeon]|nr:hypothetical protein [Candidatus Thorarchaeota archaeon]
MITVATKILSIMGMVLFAIIKGAPWWVQVLCGSEAVLTGPWRFVPLVLMIIGLASLIINLYNDMTDPDPVYGRICVGM